MINSKYVSEKKTYDSTKTTWPLNIKVDLFHQVVNQQVAIIFILSINYPLV